MEKKLKIQRVSSGVLGQVINHRTPWPLSDEGGSEMGGGRQHHRGRMDRRIFPETSGHSLAAGEV